MAIMPDHIKQQVKQLFDQNLQGEVELALFFEPAPAGADRPFDAAIRELAAELMSLTDRLVCSEHEAGSPAAQAYGLDRYPAIVVLGPGGVDHGIRYYGAPLGYEFGTLVEVVVDLSRGQTRLAETTREALRNVTRDVVIEVFSTPT